MPGRPDARIFNTVAERLHSNKPAKAIAEVALTGVGFFHPPREKLYRTTRRLLRDSEENIPLQPPVEHIAHATSRLLSDSEPIQTPRLDGTQLTRFVNTMVQFSDRASTSEAMTTPASQVSQLYEAILRKAESDGPVNYADQLGIALSHTPHLPSALWNLLITSRQYARWRDTDIIDGFPALDTPQKLQRMMAWEKSIAAVKDGGTNEFQDSAGDGYYVWTHALAQVIYTSLPQSKNLVSRAYSKAFERGSYAMSASAMLGKVSVFGTMSNHVPASRYGNAIGGIAARRVEEINNQW